MLRFCQKIFLRDNSKSLNQVMLKIKHNDKVLQDIQTKLPYIIQKHCYSSTDYDQMIKKEIIKQYGSTVDQTIIDDITKNIICDVKWIQYHDNITRFLVSFICFFIIVFCIIKTQYLKP